MKTRADRKPFRRARYNDAGATSVSPFPASTNCNSIKTLRNKESPDCSGPSQSFWFFSLILKRQPNRKLDDSRISSARDLAEERAVDVCTRLRIPRD